MQVTGRLLASVLLWFHQGSSSIWSRFQRMLSSLTMQCHKDSTYCEALRTKVNAAFDLVVSLIEIALRLQNHGGLYRPWKKMTDFLLESSESVCPETVVKMSEAVIDRIMYEGVQGSDMYVPRYHCNEFAYLLWRVFNSFCPTGAPPSRCNPRRRFMSHGTRTQCPLSSNESMCYKLWRGRRNESTHPLVTCFRSISSTSTCVFGYRRGGWSLFLCIQTVKQGAPLFIPIQSVPMVNLRQMAWVKGSGQGLFLGQLRITDMELLFC